MNEAYKPKEIICLLFDPLMMIIIRLYNRVFVTMFFFCFCFISTNNDNDDDDNEVRAIRYSPKRTIIIINWNLRKKKKYPKMNLEPNKKKRKSWPVQFYILLIASSSSSKNIMKKNDDNVIADNDDDHHQTGRM